MSKLNISAYSFMVISIANLGLWYYFRDMPNRIQDMEVRYTEMREKAPKIATFEDSLYNQDFRKRALDSISTIAELEEVIAQNRDKANEMLLELEELRRDRKQLGSDFKIYKSIEPLFNILSIISLLLVVYYWYKK